MSIEDNFEESTIEAGDQETSPPEPIAKVNSLKELINHVTGRGLQAPTEVEESGLAEILPFPFLGMVGQQEMRLALLLALVNPSMGGVLLIGPRGTGKTTAVRSLVDLLPDVPRSLCYYGCMSEDIEVGGMDAICTDCARKYAENEPLSKMESVRLIELPLNARLDDVVGGQDERAATLKRVRLHRGILAQADRNLLHVDEINLLDDDVVNALLDAAAQGRYTVRRGPISATYWSRFILIGSMNPEEGRLRPQIQDRFGLRVVVRGLENLTDRLEAYRRVQSYLFNPRQTIAQFSSETAFAREEIQHARGTLPKVIIPDEVAELGLMLINHLGIDSLRAEITLFEAARAYTAMDDRLRVDSDDIKVVAPMALRLRRSRFITDYLDQQGDEEEEIFKVLDEVIYPSRSERNDTHNHIHR